MMTLSVNKFRANLKHYVDKAINDHQPLTVNRKNGEDFVILSLEDYTREQESLYILNNNSLTSQIEKSMQTYQANSGYKPSLNELNLDEKN